MYRCSLFSVLWSTPIFPQFQLHPFLKLGHKTLIFFTILSTAFAGAQSLTITSPRQKHFPMFCLHLIIRLLQKVLWSNRNMLYTDLHMLFLLVSWISQSKLDTLNSLLIEINFPSWQIKGHEWTTLVNLERYFLIIMDRKHVWKEGAVIGRFRWGSLFVKQMIANHISSCYRQYIYIPNPRNKKYQFFILFD